MTAPHSDDVPANRRAFTFDDFDRQAVRGVDAIQNENPFGGRHLYNANIDNGLFFADVRWYVDGTMNDAETGEVIRPLTASERKLLFNGSYNRGPRIEPGEQLDLHVTFTEDGTGRYPGGYPYGYFYLTYWSTSTATPEQIFMEVYCNHQGQGVGWKTLSAQDISAANNNRFVVHRFRQSWHGISDIHLVITNDSDSTIEPNSFEHHVERRSSSEVELPFVSKLEDQRIYRRFTWRDENLNENAFIDEDGTAEFGRLRSATGPTENRPTGINIGTQYFDTTINRPIWYAGSGQWINASGGTV